MSSDGTQENPYGNRAVIVGGWRGGNPTRDIAAWAEEMRDKSERAPTFEELLEAQYSLNPEQAQQLAETLRKAAQQLGQTLQDMAEIVRGILTDLSKSPGWQELVKQFEQQQTPRQQPRHSWKNKTPTDRWRNSLGGRRPRR